MFSWFRKKLAAPAHAPAPSASASLQGTQLEAAFSNGARSWTEKADLLELATAVLAQRCYRVRAEGAALVDEANGFAIEPHMAGFKPSSNGGVQTTTIIRVVHPTLIPNGLFEYQHAAGANLEASIRSGFDQWAQIDYLVLVEATRRQPASCMVMEMSFNATPAYPARTRRAVLGPVGHMRERPAEGAAEAHPFCPCCLLTNSLDAFKPLFDGEGLVGIRLFAARDNGGTAAADCRVNGEDWPDGAAALRRYVESWPPAGVEFRKQYIVLQDVEGPTPREPVAELR